MIFQKQRGNGRMWCKGYVGLNLYLPPKDTILARQYGVLWDNTFYSFQVQDPWFSLQNAYHLIVKGSDHGPMTVKVVFLLTVASQSQATNMRWVHKQHKSYKCLDRHYSSIKVKKWHALADTDRLITRESPNEISARWSVTKIQISMACVLLKFRQYMLTLYKNI